jgi:tetratricopeptide (TPR) repeat protein
MLLFYSCAIASSGDFGTDGIFTTGAGSRADGMAGAFTAVPGDIATVHYNPAGLAYLKKQEMSLLYYPLYESSSFGSAAYGQALLDIGTVAASFSRFAVDGIEGYDVSGAKTAVFGSEQYKAALSYAKKIAGGFSAGANLNIFYSSISKFNYAGVGADIGVLYEPFPFLRAGLMARNIITPVFSMESSLETLPRTYTLGLSAAYTAAGFEFIADCDVSAGETEGFKYRAGIEAGWSGMASLRAGFNGTDITFGAGLSLFDAGFDYAYVSNQYFGRMDRFTLSYAFGMTIDEQKMQRRRAIYNEVRRIVDEKIRIKMKEEADARYNRAYEYYAGGAYEDAMAEAEKALEWKRDHEPSLKMKGILTAKLKEKLGTGVAAANDEHITAGIEFYEKMQYDEAIKQWEMALIKRPGNKAIKSLIQKARYAMQSGAGRPKVPKEQKETADRMYYMAVNSYTAGDLKGAVETWKKALEFNPDDVKIQRDLRKAQAELEELFRRGIE